MVPQSRDITVIIIEASDPIYGQEERVNPYMLILCPHSLLFVSPVPKPRE